MSITPLVIFGKNSKLYTQYLKQSLAACEDYTISRECSHNEIESLVKDKSAICIVFAYSNDSLDNYNIIEKLSLKYKRILIVGSASALSHRATSFRYSLQKRLQASSAVLLNKRAYSHILVANFGSFSVDHRIGRKYISQFESFKSSIDDVRLERSGVSQYFIICGTSNPHIVMYRLAEYILGVKLTALLFKYSTNYTYGYNIVD